ncbi:MAG: nucleotidyltransferase [Clostridiales Family XIII bacterium]|jgi:predicted nucleotidyltransferase|nr:nucleotidyltransferase [Clostridiales Family XIII bacterium]
MNDEKPKVAGIVAEYNPFHNGHLYHLEKTKALTGAAVCVAVMSGDFVQRGEPALIDKWERAEAAVENGVDLVVELPFLYACNSAEYFAKGAMRLLSAMGCVTQLSFGSEAGEIAPLQNVAAFLAEEPEAFREALHGASKRGRSFPAARFEATADLLGAAQAELLRQPNNILAIEYIKQLILIRSEITPVTFKRRGAGYFDAAPGAKIAGASALRTLLLAGKRAEAGAYLPAGEAVRPRSDAYASLDPYFTAIACAAGTKSREELREIFSASEGLENRLKRALDGAKDMESLIAGTKSRRYTETRIRRFLLHVLFGLTKEKFRRLDAAPPYLRVLALNRAGGGLLRRIRKEGRLPVITNLNKQRPEPGAAEEMLELDILAADVYHLLCDGRFGAASDFRRHPAILSQIQ